MVGSIILSGAVSATGLGNSSQPKFHHDSKNTGQSQYTGTPTNSTKWKYNIGDLIYSSASIGTDGTIYIGSQDDNLYAINPNGTTKWTYKTKSCITYSSPAIGSDGTIYIGSIDNNLYAVNHDGTTKWIYPTGKLIVSSPTIGTDGTIYIGSGDSYLYAINPNGTTKWKYLTKDAIESSPAIGTDGTIYIGCDDTNLYAINPNGTKKWTYKAGSFVTSSPAVGSDGTIYFGCYDGKLYAINPNGTTKWTYGADSIASSPAIGSDGTIYFGCFDDKLYAINPNGTTKWVFTTNSNIYSSPTIGSDGIIYIGSDDFNLYAINPDGTKKWAYKTEGVIESSPAIGSDGTIYIGSLDGNLYAILDIEAPTASINLKGGLFNINKIVKLSMSEEGIIYYTLNGSTPTTSSTQYTGPITVASTTTLKYFAIDLTGNKSPVYTETYTIDKNVPTAATNINSGTYKINKTVKLSMNENGNIYYTINGKTPTTSSTKYSRPIVITSTTTLKYFAVDQAGNKSPVYTKVYTIDKTAPKPVKTSPAQNAKNIALKLPVTIKFNEKISKGTKFANIYIKNLSTGKISKSTISIISGNTISIKMPHPKTRLNNYQIVIPTSAVKDSAGNSNIKYVLNFKTGKH